MALHQGQRNMAPINKPSHEHIQMAQWPAPGNPPCAA